MEKRLPGLIIILILSITVPVFSQQPDSLIPFNEAYKRVYHTCKLTGNPPSIDGKLEDACWTSDGEWSQNFIQNTPVERAEPSFPTRIKILFDDKNIYFALRAWDPEPDKINRFVGNRDDNSVGDLISVCFDTYHDYRAGTEFNINTGGNKTDLIVTDNLSINLNWNAVWEGKTNVNDSSWTVEFRIPLNQLRYNHSDTGMVWGLHIRRIVRRIQETDQWSLIPRKNSGHVYSFGTMVGLQGVRKPRLIEFLPYISQKATFEPRIAQSPYYKKLKSTENAGLDSKIGIGDFTLDITINPDFGQIEADPSVMNLTSFETFYDEKRPFFLEGKHIFDFSAEQNLMFYSRRIGHTPSWNPAVDNISSFSSVPEFTNIINAIKLSGTTRNGVTVGIMQSTTQRETARYTLNDVETHPVVEPLTNYAIARIQKIANKGNTQLGTMFTSVNRKIDQPQLNFLNRNAFVAGVDFLQYFRKREYFIDFRGMASYIDGREEAMLSLQQNTLHYFQRPDAQNYLGVDSSRRFMTGTGGYLSAGRQGNKRFIFSEKINWWSPGFDLNDAGYLYMADLVLNQTKVAFRQTEPKGLLRNYTVTLSQMNGWNYGGRCTYNDFSGQFAAMFNNRWEISLAETYVFAELGTRLLRGGPAFRLSPYWKNTLLFNTDKSKRVMFRLQNSSSASTDGVSYNYAVKPSLTFRVGNHIYLNGDFEYTRNTDDYQYVVQRSTETDNHYILARIRQQTYNLTIRINYNITPDISIQYYGSPFVSSGLYDHFKRSDVAASFDLNNRTHAYTGDEINYHDAENTYEVTAGLNNFTFGNPDFSFREFRSNLVFRWEYRRGSTLYFVWENRSQSRENAYHSSYGQNLQNMFDAEPVNVFMIKMNFWLGL
jgi:hypothetical protein